MDMRVASAAVVGNEADPHLAEQFKQFASKASGLGREAAEIGGILTDVRSLAETQAEDCGELRAEMERLSESQAAIADTTASAEAVARSARAAVGEAVQGTRVLAEAVSGMEAGVAAVTQALSGVSVAAREINSIAFQTRLLAFNASVEAVRAGEAGRGFAVVAAAIKDLAQQAHESSTQIGQTIAALEARIAELSNRAQRDGGAASSSASVAVEHAAAAIDRAFNGVDEQLAAIGSAARANQERSRDAAGVVERLAAGSETAVQAISQAHDRAFALLTLSEELIDLAAECGMETEDTPYIEAVLQGAASIARAFEDGIRAGKVSLADLGDVRYQPIPGTDPPQFTTRALPFLDAVLPPIQEPFLELSRLVVFCAAVDRNGYLPTHNRKFSLPQGNDPVWNAANCRNRRLFNDRTGLAAARNRKRFLLQTYRRDMGGGNFALMKDLSAPIIIQGRHWGALRLAYRFD